jgi:hypothetical protein
MRKHDDDPYVPEPGKTHESADLPLKPVLQAVLLFFVFAVGAGIITAGIFQYLVPGGFASSTTQDEAHRRLPPAPLPRLQGDVSVKKAIADMRTEENAALSTTAWVDKSKGIVQIPIERAIELTAQRGLPEWPAASATGAKTSAKGGVR